ncbi:MAG: hypothetical protein RIS35_1581 [Pseudomonadota bacterium]|jgi:hypothetical protein
MRTGYTFSYMKSALRIRLRCDAEQTARLRALQAMFAEACNALAPVAREHRCWNRVALHHMTYRSLRERFPQLGSQMACNAIYAVSRTCRQVYQSPTSPFNLQRLGDRPLPLVRFGPFSPVYFDRHTLSVRQGHLSMFTLDGRARFDVNLTETIARRFRDERLLEVVLTSVGDEFVLSFIFGGASDGAAAAVRNRPTGRLPDHVTVLPEPAHMLTGDLR